VRASQSALDAELWSVVLRWLQEEWPFAADRIDHAPR
jgi:hypothetical protein